MRNLVAGLLLIAMIGMITCQTDFAGTMHNKHSKQMRKKTERTTGEVSNNEVTTGEQKKDRKDIWIPSTSTKKLKEEWDHGYSTGFWNSMSEAPVERARAAIVAGFYFQKLFADNLESTFVDVGGGEGVMSDYLSTKQKARYTSVDISEAGVKMGRAKRPNVEFIVSPAEQFQVNEANPRKFHFVLFSEMIYYCKHKELFKQYSEKYLQPNGVIALSVWFRDNHPSAQMGPAVFADAKDAMKLIHSMRIRGTTYSYQTKSELPAGFHVGIFRPRTATTTNSATNAGSSGNVAGNIPASLTSGVNSGDGSGVTSSNSGSNSHMNDRLRSGIVSGTYYQKYVAAAKPIEGLNGAMLDIGCKDGGQLVYLLPTQRTGYVGIDPSETLIAAGKSKLGQGLQHANITFRVQKHLMEYSPTKQFSMIVFNDILYKEMDPIKAVQKYLPFLQTGGYLVLALSITTEGPEKASTIGKRQEIFDGVSKELHRLDSFIIEEDRLSGQTYNEPLVNLQVGIYQVTPTWQDLVHRVENIPGDPPWSIQIYYPTALAAKGRTIPSILNPLPQIPPTASKHLSNQIKQISDKIDTNFNQHGQQMGRKGFFW